MLNARNLLKDNDPEIYSALIGEEKRQRSGIELIPSENYTYPEVLELLGSVFTNKYSEGYPGKRYYGGQKFTDAVETLARERTKKLFRCEHANVQPLSGSPMNLAVYMALLKPGDTVLAMDLTHGGHLTHGAPVSHTGKMYNFVRYKSDPCNDSRIDFEALRRTALETKPKMILCGYTSYPKDYDYNQFKTVADEIGAITMADVSHIGGLIAGGAMKNPFDYGFDVVTTTTHKSLRGPRGGIIMCSEKFAKAIDKSVFPGLQGGPHMNVIAGIAFALAKAMTDEYKTYCSQVLTNARALATNLKKQGVSLVGGGTENHLMVVNTIESFGIDGKVAEETLDKISLTTNKQFIPDDPNPPLRPSGIRIGTPAVTTRGMMENEMETIASWMVSALRNHNDDRALASLSTEVQNVCKTFPVPGI